MTERRLGAGMRLLVGSSGAGVFALGVLLALREIRSAVHGAPPAPALIVAAGCGLAAIGGASLVRSAVQGRIALRRIRRRPRSE
jgi:hypothetical protein